jgi:homoserine O-succinyltransferase
MPIKLPDGLPAIKTLSEENIFVMSETRAAHQDIRPLKIIILNLMPLKIETETHILRLLSNTPLQVEVDFLRTETHESKNTSAEHLESFYRKFDQVKQNKYDGMIITGAPVEKIEFEQVDYWPELSRIMEWTKTNVTSTLHICWASQAGLYYHYGIPKYLINEKMFGVFSHKIIISQLPLVRGFDDEFLAPHSRYTEIRAVDIEKCPELELVSVSEEAGVYIVVDKIGKNIFITGHSEYEPNTLLKEYERDRKLGLATAPPRNYFEDTENTRLQKMRWRSHANLLFANWLNYYVYQITPFNINEIG